MTEMDTIEIADRQRDRSIRVCRKSASYSHIRGAACLRRP